MTSKINPWHLSTQDIELNQKIRKTNLILRNQLSMTDKYNYDHSIYQTVINYFQRNHFTKIACYWPTEKEVDTIALIDFFLNSQDPKYVVSLPQVISKSKMIFRKIENFNFHFEMFKNIKQPNKKNIIVNSNEIEVMLVPLLAYDDNHYRLGYGMGYYDHYLAKHKSNTKIIKIGLAYSFQKSNLFLKHANDEQLDLIINEIGEC
ncbi:5-formyltetrahydrofolate cyclo-ligase [[Mycoplasma] testudinis]|uniref:5-formyltetrahydrofolate cyclo-ligase n=1 Tax=[Mycoplasma] testudinis TaxID=33924 RepID=UPI000482F17B|nr:5-formyltetrahydrofolate cyclo-ligase [[Mycoplasma] testudinis]